MTDTALLEKTLEALRAEGLAVTDQKVPRAARAAGADAWLQIGKDRQQGDFAAQIRRAVTPATLGATLAQLAPLADQGRIPLLVTTHVTPPLADRLREQGCQFADIAGNAYLTGPGFLIHVTGRKATATTKPQRPGLAYTITGLKVQFALICDPELAAAPQRTLAAAAGAALGAVPGVLADLRREGILLVAGKKRRLLATRRLLDNWALAYARALRPKTLMTTYFTPTLETWGDWQFPAGQAFWGGEPAAHRLVGYLRPEVLTIYTQKLPPTLIIQHRLTHTQQTGGAHRVEVRKPFWGDALKHDGKPDTVPTVLVYADLLATGDARNIETARMIYDQFLARLFPAA